MKRQRTFSVNNEKIKIVSTLCSGSVPGVRTVINGKKYYSNFEIMKDYKVTENHKAVYEEFIQRAMDLAYIKWIKGNK